MPSGPQITRSYYDILGVSRAASASEIKTAYRQLARTLHPDVNPGDPHASATFADVNNAYKVLSDTLARSNYDAEESLKERRVEAARARAGGASSATFSTQGTRPASPSASPAPQTTGDEAARIITNARAALSRMRFVEARELAQRSLRVKRTAEGYEVLGDVYRMQGRTEEAINMYTMSLQLNPRNSAMMDRLQRLARGGTATSRQPEAQPEPTRRPVPTPNATPAGPAVYPTYTPRAGSVGAMILPEKRPLLKAFAVIFGYGSAFFVLLTLSLFGRDAPVGEGPIPIAAISHWSGGLLAALLGSGVLIGWTMAVTGAVRRLEDELVFSRAQSGFLPPMGAVLLVLSAVSFWAAALVHLLLSALQEARVTGVLRVFGAVVLVVLLAGTLYADIGRGQVFLWGGNVVFLSLVFGWFIGDLFRAD